METNFRLAAVFFISMLFISTVIANSVQEADYAVMLAITAISLLSIPALIVKRCHCNYIVILSLLISSVYVIYCMHSFDIFPAIDAVRYYAFLLANNSLSEIFSGAIGRMVELHNSGITDGPGSFFIFGVPVHLFYLLMPSKDSVYIIIFNYIFKMMSVYFVASIVKNISSDVFRSLLLSLIIISPTLNYFVSVLGKDIFILSMTLLLSLLLVDFFQTSRSRKKMIKLLFIITLSLYCILLRPYSPATAFIYAMFSLQCHRTIKLAMTGSFFLVAIVALSKSILILFNWPMIFAFMYMAPNPAKIQNYDSFTLAPVLCVVLTLVLFSIRLMRYKTIICDKKLSSSLLCILIYSAVMTLVGFYAIPVAYNFGSVGDAVFRKQLLIMPLVLFSILLILRERLSGSSYEK